MELGDLAAALEDYTQAIRLKPNYAEAYNNRGVTKVRLDDIRGAKVDFQIAMELAKHQDNEDLKVRLERQIQELDSKR